MIHLFLIHLSPLLSPFFAPKFFCFFLTRGFWVSGIQIWCYFFHWSKLRYICHQFCPLFLPFFFSKGFWVSGIQIWGYFFNWSKLRYIIHHFCPFFCNFAFFFALLCYCPFYQSHAADEHSARSLVSAAFFKLQHSLILL